MKTHSTNLRRRWRRATNARAFTLAEMMVALAIFSFVVIAMVVLQVFGFKMTALTQSKLGSIGYTLKALDQVRNQVRSAYSIQVGNGTGAAFTVTGTSGTTLRIFPTTNSNYMQVYLDTNSATLHMLNSLNNNQYAIASSISNQTIFQAVNYQGVVSTNNPGHYAIKMTLKFAQLGYQIPVSTYDYYTLEAAMTPRAQN
jgi:prepilin-type N-terminal cleavage/methylation domain-containing protein